MNKRSAMLVAAGLVLTMIVGGVALAVGMTGPASSAAAPRLSRHHKDPKPIVKTIKKTVKVHRKSPQVAVAMPAPSTYSGSYGSTGSSGSSNSAGYSDGSGSGSSYGGDDNSGGEPSNNNGGPSNNGGNGGGDD
jgi:hypothetical protein